MKSNPPEDVLRTRTEKLAELAWILADLRLCRLRIDARMLDTTGLLGVRDIDPEVLTPEDVACHIQSYGYRAWVDGAGVNTEMERIR